MKINGIRRRLRKKDEYRDSSCVGKWKMDLIHNKFICSDEVYLIYDLQRKGTVEQPERFQDCIYPEDKELVTMFWEQMVQGHVFQNVTHRILRNGVPRFVQYNAQYEYDEDGNLVSVFGTVRDVTDLSREDELRSFRENDESYIRDSEHAIIFVDGNLCVVRLNRAAESLFGWTEEELLFKKTPIVPPFNENSMEKLYTILLKSGGTVQFDTVRLRKDGISVDVNLILSAIKDNFGNIVGVSGVYKSITEHVQANGLLLENERQFQALVQNASDVFLILSEELTIKYVSPAIRNVLGYHPDEFLYASFDGFVHHSDIYDVVRVFQDLKSGPARKCFFELRMKHKDSEWRFCNATFHYLAKEPGIEGIVVNFHDITENKHNQELMNYMAFHDYLTNLPNRRFFEKQLKLLIGFVTEHKSRLAILFISLNRFAYINDTLGHSIGDKLVKIIALYLRNEVTPERTVCRIGGDEFSILIPNVIDKQDVVQFATRILQAFEQPFLVDQYSLYVTAGVGISFYPDDAGDVETLVKNADIALQRAKELGNSTVRVYTDTLNAKTYKEFSLANDFRRALQNDEFVLYYQPRVQTGTGAIIGAEALIRWEHPDWGLLSPAEFLNLAEDTGLIVPLGEWVVRTACKQLRDWSDAGCRDVRVSINVSAQQLIAQNLVDIVKLAIAEYRIDQHFLEFEITETSMVPNDPGIVSTIKQLRDMGMKIYFDDFGTGYSSLSWLHRFELDGIKLDKSFVSHIPIHWAPTEIVSSVIGLAHSLNLIVVAEGVEKKQQLDFLVNQGCDEIQGYLYSKPLPADEFEKLVREGSIQPNDTEDTIELSHQNRRKYFRISFSDPLLGKLTIAKINSKKLDIGYSVALISDIGPGGLRFTSNLKLPANPDVVLCFKFDILGQMVDFEGSIVWKGELSERLFEYGVQFFIAEEERERLIRLLHSLAVKMKEGMNVPGCNFYTEDIDALFRDDL